MEAVEWVAREVEDAAVLVVAEEECATTEAVDADVAVIVAAHVVEVVVDLPEEEE